MPPSTLFSATNPKQLNQIVELSHEEESEYDTEEEEPLAIKSCEVSFLVHIDDLIRNRHHGLSELKSFDIAVFFQEQLKQRSSVLMQGEISRYIVDVRFKANAFVPRYFTKWEQRWVYLISPVYFGYSAKRSEKKGKANAANAGKLPNGLQVKNPVNEFNEDEKATYMALGTEHGLVLRNHGILTRTYFYYVKEVESCL